MSADEEGYDEAAATARLKLCCEVCWTEYQPQQFGAATVWEVPESACCSRCGGLLCGVDPD